MQEGLECLQSGLAFSSLGLWISLHAVGRGHATNTGNDARRWCVFHRDP